MNGDGHSSFLPKSRTERMVTGLRSFELANPVRVYLANPDGTIGKFLRIERATYYGDELLDVANKIRGA